MELDLYPLLPYEKEALLEALRRDLRSEMNLALRRSSWQFWHQRNVQLSLRILEAINPKGQYISKNVRLTCLATPVSDTDSEAAACCMKRSNERGVFQKNYLNRRNK